MGNQLFTCGVGPIIDGIAGATLALFEPSGVTLDIQLKLSAATNVHSYSTTYEDALADFFTENTMAWIDGKGIIYQGHEPNNLIGLVSLAPENVWKYDLSGETDYGLVEPPINDPNYDLFDSNWSAQFVVFSRDSNFGCKSLELDWCSHTKGLIPRGVTNPYEACPAQDKIPSYVAGGTHATEGTDPTGSVYAAGSTYAANPYGNTAEAEPSYLELYTAYKEMNECALIEKELGKDYLGCVWNEPKHPCSCNCPEQGGSFHKYLAYTRTFATFWETPFYAPLYRNAQIGQLKSNTIIATVTAHNTVKLKLGMQIYIDSTNELSKRENRRMGGVWLITGIRYEFIALSSFKMHLTLMRDVLHHDYKSSSATGSVVGITTSRSVSTPAGHQTA